MIFVAIGIAILFASFVIALISLVREQNHVNQGSVDIEENSVSENRTMSQEPAENQTNEPDLAVFGEKDHLDEHARLKASHLESMFTKDEPQTSTAEYEPFPWEESYQSRKTTSFVKPTFQEETDFQQKTDNSKLVGEVNLKDIPEKT